MSEKPVAAQPAESTRPGTADMPTDANRPQAAERPGGAPEEASSRPADTVRAKIAELGISEADVGDAIRWARSTEQPSE